MLLESINLKRHEPNATCCARLMLCGCNQQRMFQHNVCKYIKCSSISIRHFVSITQAAAVITSSWHFGFEYDELEVYPLDGDYTMDVDVYCGDQYYLNGSPTHFDQKPWYIQSTAGEIFNYYTATAFNTDAANERLGYVEIDYVYNEGDEGITNHMTGNVRINSTYAITFQQLHVYF